MRPYALGLWRARFSACALCSCRAISLGFLCQKCHDSLPWRDKVLLLHDDAPMDHLSIDGVDFNLDDKIDDKLDNAPDDLSLQNFAQAPKARALKVYALCQHDGAVRRALIDFKYQEQLYRLALLVHIIAQLPHLSAEALLLCVPSTRARVNRRGFDPLSVLAPYVAKALGAVWWRDGAVRVHDDGAQAGKSREERLLLDHAFMVGACAHETIVIFDDVVTTGSTMRQMAKAVAQANPKAQILGVCLTHGD